MSVIDPASRRTPVRWTTLGIALGIGLLAPASMRAQAEAPDAVPGAPAGAPAKVVTFCVSGNNLPLSSHGTEREGIEVELVRAISARARVTPRFTWLEIYGGRPEQALRDGRCDAAVGIIAGTHGLAERPSLEGLAITAPYYATEYLVLRKRGTEPLQRLEQAADTRLAVEGESVAAYTLRQRGRRVHVVPTHEDVVAAVTEGRARYGYVWGPVTAWAIRDDPMLVLEALQDAPDRWNFALAVRAGDADLRKRLDAAIAALQRDGTADRVCRAYQLPRCRPT